jgi:hypothetical protein
LNKSTAEAADVKYIDQSLVLAAVFLNLFSQLPKAEGEANPRLSAISFWRKPY